MTRISIFCHACSKILLPQHSIASSISGNFSDEGSPETACACRRFVVGYHLLLLVLHISRSSDLVLFKSWRSGQWRKGEVGVLEVTCDYATRFLRDFLWFDDVLLMTGRRDGGGSTSRVKDPFIEDHFDFLLLFASSVARGGS